MSITCLEVNNDTNQVIINDEYRNFKLHSIARKVISLEFNTRVAADNDGNMYLNFIKPINEDCIIASAFGRQTCIVYPHYRRHVHPQILLPEQSGVDCYLFDNYTPMNVDKVRAGLQVFNEHGEKLFDSEYPVLRLLDYIDIDINDCKPRQDPSDERYVKFTNDILTRSYDVKSIAVCLLNSPPSPFGPSDGVYSTEYLNYGVSIKNGNTLTIGATWQTEATTKDALADAKIDSRLRLLVADISNL
nr:MAG TPA: hypothetical protein [Caudoviricetes sp.]